MSDEQRKAVGAAVSETDQLGQSQPRDPRSDSEAERHARPGTAASPSTTAQAAEERESLALSVTPLAAAPPTLDESLDELPASGRVSPDFPRTPHSRLPRVAASALLLALICLLLVTTLPEAPDVLRTVLHLPTPTATPGLALNADLIYFIHPVPWGDLRIDGASVASATVNLDTQPSGPLRLERGRHTLAYKAPPFSPVQCVVSVPALPADTCVQGSFQDSGIDGSPPAVRVIDLQAVPERLPPASYTQLLAALHQAIDLPARPAMVVAGERYLDADGTIQLATQPLVAALVQQVGASTVPPCASQDPNLFSPDGSCEPCPLVCAAVPDPHAPAWLLWVHLDLGWRFERMDGSVLAQLAPLAPDGEWYDWPYQEVESTVHGGAWQVIANNPPPSPNPGCTIASGWVSNEANAPGTTTHYLITTTSANPFSAGCLVTVAPVDILGQSLGAPAYFLYRFGVLLAVDAAAHQLLPELPRATAAEVSLANQLASQPAP